jgi:hypothetical protein
MEEDNFEDPAMIDQSLFERKLPIVMHQDDKWVLPQNAMQVYYCSLLDKTTVRRFAKGSWI